MTVYIINSIKLFGKFRTTTVGGHKFNLGECGEPLSAYLGRRDGHILRLPDDIRSVNVTLIDVNGERDGRGLFPSYAKSWAAVGAPDIPAPGMGLESTEIAVDHTITALELAETDHDDAADAIADALEALDIALAHIQRGIDVARATISTAVGDA